MRYFWYLVHPSLHAKYPHIYHQPWRSSPGVPPWCSPSPSAWVPSEPQQDQLPPHRPCQSSEVQQSLATLFLSPHCPPTLKEGPELVDSAWPLLLTIGYEKLKGRLTCIPHICHRHHRRCLCKTFLSGVKFSRLKAKKCIIYTICFDFLVFFVNFGCFL